MKKTVTYFIVFILLFLFACCTNKNSNNPENYSGKRVANKEKQLNDLKRIVELLPPDNTKSGHVSFFRYYVYRLAKKKVEELKNGKLPVVIYLHEYDFNQGFSSMAFDHEIQSFFEKMVEQGFAVFAYDRIGFGNRNEEGTRFNERYPHWSKMGKSVADLKGAVDALTHYDLIDSSKIFVVGYSC